MIEQSQSYTCTWCPVCDKRISDKGKDTYGLLSHIRKFHPRPSNHQLHQKEEIRAAPKCPVASSRPNGSVYESRKSEPKKVYATRVDTWKSHNEKKLCPQCKREAVPTLHTRGDKLTTSHIGALCLLGCWPLCFVPLMMKRAKKVRMICPLCGYIYGSFQYKNTELQPCKNESGDLQARLSSPPTSFRVQAAREEFKN